MKIITAIASTTHIDRHNEKMAKCALESMAEQACAKYIRFLIEHDPSRPIGVILAAKVLPMDDGEWALAVVSGIFDKENEFQIYKYGMKNTVSEQYMPILNDMQIPLKAAEADSSQIKRDMNLAQMIEMHLDSTEVWPDGKVLKTKRFIASTGDLEIHIYPNDHLPAHFHVISKQRKIDARFGIETFELLDHKHGHISSKDQKKIKNLFESDSIALSLLKAEFARFNSFVK